MDSPEAPVSDLSPNLGYFNSTRTATWGFLMALPLMAIYEWGIMRINFGSESWVRISSEMWIRQLIPSFGMAQEHVLVGLVALIGILIVVLERNKGIAYRMRFPVLIILESAVYAVILAFLVGGLTAIVVNAAPAQAMQELDLQAQLVLSVGAGLYEELLFRVILVTGLFWLMRLMLPNRIWLAYTIAAVVGALAFSGMHHIGTMGDAWDVGTFAYRAIFGLAFNVLYLARGFGVVAWSHALYDVMVVTGFFPWLVDTVTGV